MPIANTTGTPQGLVLAALLAVITNWNETEARQGRRGEYHTTGANMVRVSELTDDEKELVIAAANAIGVDCTDEDIAEVFDGEYEYQASLSCNRFGRKGSNVAGVRLTQNDMRTVERFRRIAESKPQAIEQILKKIA